MMFFVKKRSSLLISKKSSIFALIVGVVLLEATHNCFSVKNGSILYFNVNALTLQLFCPRIKLIFGVFH